MDGAMGSDSPWSGTTLPTPHTKVRIFWEATLFGDRNRDLETEVQAIVHLIIFLCASEQIWMFAYLLQSCKSRMIQHNVFPCRASYRISHIRHSSPNKDNARPCPCILLQRNFFSLFGVSVCTMILTVQCMLRLPDFWSLRRENIFHLGTRVCVSSGRIIFSFSRRKIYELFVVSSKK